jgi:hypothetical protein
MVHATPIAGAGYGHCGRSLRTIALLIAADQALYRAKALGRNRIELSTLSPQPPSARVEYQEAANVSKSGSSALV